MRINKTAEKTAWIALLFCIVFGISGCSKNDQVVGTWRCSGNAIYVFNDRDWSRINTPSSNLPYYVKGEYIFMTTLANDVVPMLKLKEGLVHNNYDGTGLADVACTKLI